MKICNCQKELKLICRKKIPLYYLYRHIHAELNVEIYECMGCGLRVAEVPKQTFKETREEQQAYEEDLKNVSIL